MSEKKDIRKLIGDKFKKIRLELKYSLQQMADKCDIDYAHYCQIEQGKRYIRLDILQRISGNLGISIDFWLKNIDVDKKLLSNIYSKAIYEDISSLEKDKKEFLFDLITAYKKVNK